MGALARPGRRPKNHAPGYTTASCNQLKSEKGTLVMTPRTPTTVLKSLVITMG